MSNAGKWLAHEHGHFADPARAQPQLPEPSVPVIRIVRPQRGASCRIEETLTRVQQMVLIGFRNSLPAYPAIKPIKLTDSDQSFIAYRDDMSALIAHALDPSRPITAKSIP